MIPITYSQWKYKSRKLFIWIWLIYQLKFDDHVSKRLSITIKVAYI